MTTSLLRARAVFAVLALSLVCAGTARAQYSGVTLNTGAELIVGNGNSLGALSVGSGTLTFLPNGNNQLILNPGSLATAGGTNIISFTASNNLILNSGSIVAGNYVTPGNISPDAVNFTNSGSAPLSGEIVTNNGSVIGGAGNPPPPVGLLILFTAGANGGDGIDLDSSGDILSSSVTNNGSAKGGNGGQGYNGGEGIEFNAGGAISGVTVANSGQAIGGNGGSGDKDIEIIGTGSFTLPGFSGTAGPGYTGGNGGDGINFNAASIDGVSVAGSGLAMGGNGAAGTAGDQSPGAGVGIIAITGSLPINFPLPLLSATATYMSGSGGAGGNGGDGIGFNASGGISGVALASNGSNIGGAGGVGGGAGSFSGSAVMGPRITGSFAGTFGFVYSFNLGPGGNGGQGGNGIAFNSGDAITDVAVTTHGLSMGGDGGAGGAGSNITGTTGASFLFVDSFGGGAAGAGGNGGDGISFDSSGGVLVTNYGPAIGGNGGPGGSAGNIAVTEGGMGSTFSGSDGSGGNGGNGGSGIGFSSGGGLHDVTLINQGSATGGNGAPGGAAGSGTFTAGVAGSPGSGGSGVSFNDFPINSGNLVLANFGRITGGNGAPGGAAGNGVFANSGNLVINNWGIITTGSGSSPAAINLQNNNNVVNLDGHSTVNGRIILAGSNDVVNLNFTGLTAGEQAALRAQILAQGNLSEFSGTFTVRGVTYDIDPAKININTSSYEQEARTPNQAAIGAVFDGINYNPAPGTPLFTLLNAIDRSGNVPGALDALSPVSFAALGDIAIGQSDFLVNSIDARLDNIRNGSESVDTSGVGGATVAGLTKNDGKSSKEIEQTMNPTPDRWGFFATGDGLFFRGDSRNTGLDDKSNSAGTLIGLDGRIGDKGVIGALFSYDNTSAQLDGAGSHANIESYSGGLYGSYHDGGLYFNSLAAYTRNNYDTTRNIAFGGLGAATNGSTNGNQETVDLDGGYDWNMNDRFSVGPILGAQYVHLNIDGFSETGLPAAGLNVASQDINSVQSRLGAHANYHLATSKNSTVALDLHAAWQHEYLDDSRAIGASFEGTGLSPFAVQSGSPKRDAGAIGLGVNATFHDRFTLFADYELEMWSASYFEQSINGGARISF